MQTIATKYLGATNFNGSRIKATNDGLDDVLIRLEYALNVNAALLTQAANVVRQVNQEVTA